MATHCSLLAWRTPWTEESGRLQCMGLQRFGMSGHLRIHKTHYSFVSSLFLPIFLLCFFQYFQKANSLEIYLRTAKITIQLTDLSANKRWKKRSKFFPLCSIKKKKKNLSKDCLSSGNQPSPCFCSSDAGICQIGESLN